MAIYAPPANRADAGYLDFVEGIKFHSGRAMERQVNAFYLIKEKEFEAEHGRKPEKFREIDALMESSVLNKTREFLDRWSQEMMWERSEASYAAQSDKLLAELEEKLHQGPGTVELNPDIEYPDYFEGMDFHLMPGNYNHGDLTGYIYDWAVKVFYFGVNDTDKTQRLLIEKAIQLPKRKIERALDLGCGIGQDATPIKVFCPDAEVIGLDLGGPMLKYAHKRAIDQGVDVTFTQRAAEDTGYPNQHFDFIFAFQLFHELPVRAMKDVLEEAHRILRPGGAMVIADIPRTVNVTPYRRWLRQWQVRNINEPFMGTYVDEDIPALIKNAGFKNAREELAYEPVPGGAFQAYFQIGER